MHTANKLVLLAISTVAAMVLMVPVATATTNEDEFVRDATNSHCPAVLTNPISGGCEVHAEGEITFQLHIFGIESIESRCLLELEGHVDENGEGYVTRIHNEVHPLDSCTEASYPPCSPAESESPTNDFPWPFHSEESSTGVLDMHIDACFDPAEAAHCEGEIRANVTEEENDPSGGQEAQHFEQTDGRVGASSFCEFTMDIETELNPQTLNGHERIHIRHVNP